MANNQKTNNDVSERAKELYENVIKHELTDEQLGLYLAIDVDSGDYEIGERSLDIPRALRARRPNARIFGMRHGSYTTGSIGFVPPKSGLRILIERLPEKQP